MHIVYNNFEQAAFGKLPSNIGFMKVVRFKFKFFKWETGVKNKK
jgi:hypothetical protein